MAITKVSRGLLSTGIVDNSNATAITIDSSENVGIGTTSPAGKLQAYTSANRFQSLTGASADLEIVSDNNTNPVALIKGTGNADLLNVFDNTTEVFTILDGGNVGIGTTSPNFTLGLHKASSDANYIQITNSTTGSGSGDGAIIGLGSDESLNVWQFESESINFGTNNSTRMTIDSSGNVGIGTTSPSSKISVVGGASDAGISIKSGGNAGVDPFRVTWTSGTEGDMFIVDDSGNVGIGIASPTSKLDVRGVFHVGASAGTTPVIGRSLAPSGSQGMFITASVVNSESTTTPTFADNSSSGASIYLGGNAGDQYGGNVTLKAYGAAGTSTCNLITFENRSGTNTFSERMRIDSSGNLLVGVTSFGDSGGGTSIAGGLVKISNSSTSNSSQMFFTNPNGAVGSISSSGSATSYNTSSDARLKDITGEARGLEVINELNPVAYNWKADGKADEGLIAQEVMEIVPNAVSGSEEDMYQMDYSKLVTPLIKAIQELSAEVEELKTKLENK